MLKIERERGETEGGREERKNEGESRAGEEIAFLSAKFRMSSESCDRAFPLLKTYFRRRGQRDGRVDRFEGRGLGVELTIFRSLPVLPSSLLPQPLPSLPRTRTYLGEPFVSQTSLSLWQLDGVLPTAELDDAALFHSSFLLVSLGTLLLLPLLPFKISTS